MIGSARRSWRFLLWRMTFVLWLSLLILVSAIGLAVLAYGSRYVNRIYEGVTILGVDVSGLGSAQARARLEAQVDEWGLPYVTLSAPERQWTLALSDLGGHLDLDTAVDTAWKLGRSGVFREDWTTRLRLLWQGYNIVPPFHLERGRGIVHLRYIARQAEHPARRADLWIEGLQAKADASAEGRELDIADTINAIERAVNDALGQSGWGVRPRLVAMWQAHAQASPVPVGPVPVPLRFRRIVPPLTQVMGAEERVQALLQGPLLLSCDDQTMRNNGEIVTWQRRWMVDRAVLVSWLTIHQGRSDNGVAVQVGIDRQRIRAFLQGIADELALDPRDGRFGYVPSTGEISVLEQGQYGRSLDIDRAVELVAEACLSERRHVALPITVIPPRMTAETLRSLGPLALIGEGESGFVGSTPERLQNIRRATERFHGRVVMPGETFSFLAYLGPVTTANGYSPSWIIMGDRTILGPGGGVCQVSTTCFRAAFWAGYPIVERSPHTYRVSWYEPPIGFDAAVFSPSVDFKFRNDTAAPLLIQTEVDEANMRLYFRFYSKPTGRKVTMEGPVTANPIKAGEPILEIDPSLPPGKRVLIDRAHDGIDVTLYRLIEGSDGVVKREEFFSRYEPWPARYRVGVERSQ